MYDFKAGMIQGLCRTRRGTIPESEILCGYMSMITHKPDITHSRNDCASNATSFCNEKLPMRHLGLSCRSTHINVCTKAVTVPITSGLAVAIELIPTLNYFKHFTTFK